MVLKHPEGKKKVHGHLLFMMCSENCMLLLPDEDVLSSWYWPKYYVKLIKFRIIKVIKIWIGKTSYLLTKAPLTDDTTIEGRKTPNSHQRVVTIRTIRQLVLFAKVLGAVKKPLNIYSLCVLNMILIIFSLRMPKNTRLCLRFR